MLPGGLRPSHDFHESAAPLLRKNVSFMEVWLNLLLLCEGVVSRHV